VAPVEYAEKLACPVLGLFGNEDANPKPDHVNRLEATLKKLGKTYEFHRYDGAGHAFMSWYRPHYRVEQAVDAWKKVLDFYGRHLKAA
jgi:carboxymethylenebutenolidase